MSTEELWSLIELILITDFNLNYKKYSAQENLDRLDAIKLVIKNNHLQKEGISK